MFNNRDVMGFSFFDDDIEAFVRYAVEESVRDGFSVAFCNAHMISLARRNREFGEVLNGFEFVFSDGRPLSVIYSLPHLRGMDFFRLFFKKKLDCEGGLAEVAFIGGDPQKIAGYFREEYGLKKFDGKVIELPFAEEYILLPKISDFICRSPEIKFVFVGLGCPKQENIIKQLQSIFPDKKFFAVGAVFDFISGEKSEAPKLVQDIGLEWAYRLFQDPARLFPRYLKYNLLFIYLSIITKLKE